MKKIFVFPGQGAHVNKIAVLKMYDQKIFEKPLAIISEACGFDVFDFACTAHSQELSDVKYTQIVMFASSVAFLEIARHNGIVPDLLAGHSIGQFSALYAAGSFELFELASLIKERAILMSQIKTKGQLCAVTAPQTIDLLKIQNLCASVSAKMQKKVEVALINSNKQVTVGGETKAIQTFIEQLKYMEQGYKAVMLPVGQAFHTNLMDTMLLPFADCLKKMTIKAPKIPIILNTTGKLYTTENITCEILNHCIKPVQWRATMELIGQIDRKQIYEVGLGRTLKGFFRHVGEHQVINMENKKDFVASLSTM